MRLASYHCSTPQYKKEMYIDTTQAFRPIINWDIEWFHRLHFLLDILLYSRFGFVVGALSSLRLSVMLTQITIQSSNTVIWQVTRLHDNEFTCKPMNCSRLQHFYFLWADVDSNHGHLHLQCSALPTELSAQTWIHFKSSEMKFLT